MPDLKPLFPILLCAAGACLGGGTLLAWLVLKVIDAEPCGGCGPSWGEIKHQALIERQLGRR